MYRYILYRLLLFIPTLLVLILITFLLTKWAPGDPVALMHPQDVLPDASSTSSYQKAIDNYRRHAKVLGLDKPLFYIDVSNQVIHGRDSVFVHPDRRQAIRALSWQAGSFQVAEAYYEKLQQLQTNLTERSGASPEVKRALSILWKMQFESNPKQITQYLEELGNTFSQDTTLQYNATAQFDELSNAFQQIRERSPDRSRWFVPALAWHGTNNQFHNWLTGLFSGNLGASYRDHRPVFNKIMDALKWTLLINGLAIILALLISVPLGVYSALKKGSTFDQVIHFVLLSLYAIPVFWTATVLLVFFTTPEYGSWTNLFPSMGVGFTRPDMSVWEIILTRVQHLFLPVICLSYPSLAFLSRQMRASMLKVLARDYIRQARAMGLPKRKIIWDYAFKNALFPMITLLGSIIPASITGSLIIEVIFSIPGTGKLLVESIFARDWPVVYGVVLLVGLVTVLAYLLVDILYRALDPRVKTNYQTQS